MMPFSDFVGWKRRTILAQITAGPVMLLRAEPIRCIKAGWTEYSVDGGAKPALLLSENPMTARKTGGPDAGVFAILGPTNPSLLHLLDQAQV
ncbi:MAG: hypothetical protein EA425_09565 [Puniceicoccaceae bacterium]|nr:MAG: hypothetical protein EA425_09565 [Puniceicoccaceae bacterium]